MNLFILKAARKLSFIFILLCATNVQAQTKNTQAPTKTTPTPTKSTQGECSPTKESKPAHLFHDTKGGDWFTRLRALYVYPNDSSGSVSSIHHSGVSVNPSWTGEFDVAYYFTKNLGAELIAGTCKNTLMGKKSLSGTEIGTVWLLPPTLTLQWRFFPSSIAQPYVGAGGNFTWFYGEHSSLKSTKLELSNSWGPAVQMGMDIFFYEDWLFNVDAKYVWVHTNAHLHGAVNGKVHVDVNPWMIGFGFGRKW